MIFPEPSFVAFIDESGDEGYDIQPPPNRKSSEWFILSAVICRSENVDRLGKELADFIPFHFRKAKHHECVAITNRLSFMNLTAISILAHKPSVPDDAAIRNRKHYLFDYATKLLIERISWFCNDNRGPEPGTVRIIFSQRRQLKIERILNYLRHLKDRTEYYDETLVPELARNSIKWRVIDFRLIEAQPHDSMPGLQAADAVVTSTGRAVEYSPTVNTEHRYIKNLSWRFYRRNKRCQSYGIKFIPELPPEDMFLPDRFHWLHRFQ